jgi:regulator of sirC expression with transglutaminase-like and TPR domain
MAELTPEQKENIDFAMAAFDKLARMALLCDKDHDHVITELTKIIDKNPNDASAYVDRGKTYNQLKDYTSAIADFEMALMLRPDNNDFSELLEKAKADKIQSNQDARSICETLNSYIDLP